MRNKMKQSFVSLLSTGLDSPISTFLMMHKGYDCLAISFIHNYKNSDLNKKKLIEIGKKLVQLTNNNLTLYLIDYDPILESFVKNSQKKTRCILCKRTMLDFAQDVAKNNSSKFIVTGDILGEQASQTLDNLKVIDSIIKYPPIIRPLIGFNKLDIIKLSQYLGFYEISLLEENSCNFNPKHPETRASEDIIIEEESNINRDKLIQKISNNIEIIKL